MIIRLIGSWFDKLRGPPQNQEFTDLSKVLESCEDNNKLLRAIVASKADYVDMLKELKRVEESNQSLLAQLIESIGSIDLNAKNKQLKDIDSKLNDILTKVGKPTKKGFFDRIGETIEAKVELNPSVILSTAKEDQEQLDEPPTEQVST